MRRYLAYKRWPQPIGVIWPLMCPMSKFRMSHLSMPKKIQLHTCLPVENELGEGVVWDARQQCAFWTDILGKQFYRWDFDDHITQYPCP
ncbi:MAG: SMP-30/gluconolactonase/LRE family protein, partial [Paraglaciecola chathamensis]